MRRFFLFLGLTLIAIALIGGWFVNAAWLSQPEAGAPIQVPVASGMSARDVRSLLASKGLVSALAYGVFSRLDASAARPKAGTYTFRKGTSYAQIARVLAIGPEREEVEIRLIEGKTLDNERDVISAAGSDPAAFVKLVGASKNALPFDRSLATDYPFLSSIPQGMSLEGYLFPDTYRVWKDRVAEALVRKQLDEFGKNVVTPFAAQQQASGMTWHQVVTLASIVEAEVRTPEDRKIVAGIFLNRLNNSMRLQSDATLNYAIGEGRDRATAEDLQLNSPYNTYLHDGLPPGPVSNPSLSSLSAVLNSTKTNYYYFLTDKKGKVYYARTNDEHVKNKQEAFGN